MKYGKMFGGRKRLGVSAVIVVAALAIVLGAAFLLDQVAEREGSTELVEYVRERGEDPIDFGSRAARANQFVFLGDVPALAGPKRIAADLIEAIAQESGLDAVVLAISSDLQPHIERYLESDPENAGVLTAVPGVFQDGGGSPAPFLRIFRTVWRLNQELGVDRRIRILAADLPEWPPSPGTSPRRAAEMYGERDRHMFERVHEHFLEVDPRARLFFFMNGLHLLDGIQPHITVGGGRPSSPRAIASLMRERYPADVYTILTDGSPGASAYAGVVAFTATGAYDVLRRHLGPGGRALALPIGEAFDLIDDPVQVVSSPGIDVAFRPRDFNLRDVADGYIFVGTSRGVD